MAQMAMQAQSVDPFDAALANLKGILVDLDGDGSPDAAVAPQDLARGAGRASVVPQFRPEATGNPLVDAGLQSLPNYGFGPMTPMSRSGGLPQGEIRSRTPTVGDDASAYLSSRGPIGERVAPVANALLDFGPVPAQGVVEQFDRAGTAVADAYNDPSLANVTNAGVQSAMAVGRPVAAGAMLGAGMLEGARRDFAPDVFGSADAQSLNRKQRREQEMMDRQAMREREAELARIRAQSEAKRAEDDAAAVRQAEAEKKALELQKEQEANAEYRRAISRAETLRDDELAKKWSFADSNAGKVFRASGGMAPMVLGAVGGYAGRLAHGDKGGVLRTYAGPTMEGALMGVGAANAPVFADYLYAPKVNPDKAAAGAYGRELPPGHQRKQEYLGYAAPEGMPGAMSDINPVYKAAEDVVWSEFPERLASGAFEGAGGGIFGATLGTLTGRSGNALLNLGRGRASQPTSPPPAGGGNLAPHINFQPRDTNGRTLGPPKYPKGDPRRRRK
jgi:hypothetical protein